MSNEVTLELGPLLCPSCGSASNKVLETRDRSRRRKCLNCDKVYRTEEVIYGQLPLSYWEPIPASDASGLLMTLFARVNIDDPLIADIAQGWSDLWPALEPSRKAQFRAMLVAKGFDVTIHFNRFMEPNT